MYKYAIKLISVGMCIRVLINMVFEIISDQLVKTYFVHGGY